MSSLFRTTTYRKITPANAPSRRHRRRGRGRTPRCHRRCAARCRRADRADAPPPCRPRTRRTNASRTWWLKTPTALLGKASRAAQTVSVGVARSPCDHSRTVQPEVPTISASFHHRPSRRPKRIIVGITVASSLGSRRLLPTARRASALPRCGSCGRADPRTCKGRPGQVSSRSATPRGGPIACPWARRVVMTSGTRG